MRYPRFKRVVGIGTSVVTFFSIGASGMMPASDDVSNHASTGIYEIIPSDICQSIDMIDLDSLFVEDHFLFRDLGDETNRYCTWLEGDGHGIIKTESSIETFSDPVDVNLYSESIQVSGKRDLGQYLIYDDDEYPIEVSGGIGDWENVGILIESGLQNLMGGPGLDGDGHFVVVTRVDENLAVSVNTEFTDPSNDVDLDLVVDELIALTDQIYTQMIE